MVWQDLNTTITGTGLTGMTDYANQSTSGYFGGAIVFLVWITVLIATNRSYPRFSFVTSGFFAMLTALILKWTLATFSDLYLLAAIGSFIVALVPVMFRRVGY